METTYCAQCGLEFEGKGIPFRGRVFCGDECCEAFEAEFVAMGEPGLADLDDEELGEDELDEVELDLEDAPAVKDDDDFAIEPDDF